MMPLRILTILIDDVRSGQSDHQLAEVRVPLKPAEDIEDGFWADSHDVCKKLQESPSRIDGVLCETSPLPISVNAMTR